MGTSGMEVIIDMPSVNLVSFLEILPHCESRHFGTGNNQSLHFGNKVWAQAHGETLWVYSPSFGSTVIIQLPHAVVETFIKGIAISLPGIIDIIRPFWFSFQKRRGDSSLILGGVAIDGETKCEKIYANTDFDASQKIVT
jgi:hypothetical protein